MIDKELFEFHKSIVDWLISIGVRSEHALLMTSYAEIQSIDIPRSFIDLKIGLDETEKDS